MSAADDIAAFLASRRARVTPEQAGLATSGRRRVPGLRREEVASLAGVSVDYYRQLERGQVHGVSELVLESLARALELDEAEREHLHLLGRAISPDAPRLTRRITGRLRPVVQRLLDQNQAPALAGNVRADVLGGNALARALFAPVLQSSERPANHARFMFLDPAAGDFYPDWDDVASELVAALRSTAGRDPHDRVLQDLVSELSARSDAFRERWSDHDVRFHKSGRKRVVHPDVGEIELSYETLTVDADDGVFIAVYATEPGSASERALELLAARTATSGSVGGP